MDIRYFVYRKKDGNSKYTHINHVFYNREEAIEEANKYNDSYIECVNYTGKILERWKTND